MRVGRGPGCVIIRAVGCPLRTVVVGVAACLTMGCTEIAGLGDLRFSGDGGGAGDGDTGGGCAGGAGGVCGGAVGGDGGGSGGGAGHGTTICVLRLRVRAEECVLAASVLVTVLALSQQPAGE